MYCCRWDFCPHTFPSPSALASHVREHVAREEAVYIPPSARHLGPEGQWAVDDSWSLSLSAGGDTTSVSTDTPVRSGISGISGLSAGTPAGLDGGLDAGLGANLGDALTGSGYGLGAAFFAQVLDPHDPMGPPPPPEPAQADSVFADFLRSPSPRQPVRPGVPPSISSQLSQASLRFSQQMQSTPADAGQSPSQSSAAAVSPPTETQPKTQRG